MYEPGREPVNGPRASWYEALDQPGAIQMRHLRTLMESRPVLVRVPDQSLVTSPTASGTDRIQVTRGADGSYAFGYSASGRPFNVDLSRISGGGAVA